MPPQPLIPNNAEIDQALKEFEAKSKQEQPVQAIITPQSPQDSIHKVEGVSFDTDTQVESYKAIKFYNETVEPKMVKAVMKLSGGVVKDQRQAEWILFGFVVVAIGISLYLVFGGVGSSKAKPLTSSQIEQIIKNQQGIQNP
jgi:hypothetical protein